MGRAVGARVPGSARPRARSRPGPRRDPGGGVQLPRHPHDPGEVPGQAAPPVQPGPRDRGGRPRGRLRRDGRPSRPARHRQPRVGRLRGASGGRRRARASDSRRDAVRPGCGLLRRLPDGILRSGPARRPPAGRVAPRPRRGGGRGPRGRPAGQGARRPRHRHRRHAGEARDRPAVGGGRSRRLPHGGLGRAREERHGRRGRGRDLRPRRGRRLRRLDQVHRVRGAAPHDRLRRRPHPDGRRQSPAPQEHQRGRGPLGLLPAARLATRPGVDGRPHEALRRGPDPARDLPRPIPSARPPPRSRRWRLANPTERWSWCHE